MSIKSSLDPNCTTGATPAYIMKDPLPHPYYHKLLRTDWVSYPEHKWVNYRERRGFKIEPTPNIIYGFLNKDNHVDKSLSWDKLTDRERQVIKLVAEGNKNKEIAEKLSVSVKTVEKHRSNLMKKLGLHNISALTTYALENKIIG